MITKIETRMTMKTKATIFRFERHADRILTAVLGVTLILLMLLQPLKVFADSDFLWNVVTKECVPNQIKTHSPAPCDEVVLENDQQHGHVIFKDRNGPLQYLLLPTTKVTGIESSDLLKADEPNYFYRAWVARSFMIKKLGRPIDDQEISLAINSQRGRSQNQLHIHISCLRPDVRDLIQKEFQKKPSVSEVAAGETHNLKDKWQEFPGGLLGHKYFVRSISLEQLKTENVFSLLAELIKSQPAEKPALSPFADQQAAASLGDFGLALVSLSTPKNSGKLLLLANKANLLAMNRGHIEEIQDHTCPQLYQDQINAEKQEIKIDSKN